MTVPGTRAAPVRVREALRDIDELGGIIDDVLQVVSELINSVIRRVGGTGDARLEVSADVVDDAVAISVSARSAIATGEQERNGGWTAPDALGRVIVDKLAEHWEIDSERVRAWALLPRRIDDPPHRGSKQE
jgi:hypothetical protein